MTNLSNIFISIGNINIYWYSVLILIAIMLGYYIVRKEAPRRGLSVNYISDLVFYMLCVAIIGARLYYVIFNYKIYKGDFLSIFKVWEGGLAIYGGVIAGIIFIYFYNYFILFYRFYRGLSSPKFTDSRFFYKRSLDFQKNAPHGARNPCRWMRCARFSRRNKQTPLSERLPDGTVRSLRITRLWGLPARLRRAKSFSRRRR